MVVCMSLVTALRCLASSQTLTQFITRHISTHLSCCLYFQVRSTSDAELLYDAKYGKREENGKMTPEQAAALRRRVVGTAKGAPCSRSSRRSASALGLFFMAWN